MILTLEIVKKASSVYIAKTLANGTEVTEPGVYTNIEDAIREEALAIPKGFAHFLEVRYDGFSSGTELVEDVPGKAQAITDRLMGLVLLSHNLPNSVTA